MRPRRVLKFCLFGLLVIYLALGAWQLIDQLGEIPAYGDSTEYMILGTVLKVDQYRGILYPAFLAGLDRVMGGRLLADYHVETLRANGVPEAPPRSTLWIQILQLLFSALAILYALWATLLPSAGWRLVIPLAAILFLDPVVAHLNASILTDGPCLAFLLLMAGGLVSLLRAKGSPWMAWSMIFLGGMGCSLLRVEKAYVVGLVLILIAGVCLWLRRRGQIDIGRRSSLSLVAMALIVVLGSQAIAHAFYAPTMRWPREISWLNERVIRPHLHTILRDLPRELRGQLSPEQVEEYDTSVQGARKVMAELSQGDPERLEKITREMADTVLYRYPGVLAGEVARNSVENLFITPAFYLRVSAHASGQVPEIWAGRVDGNVWTYMLITRDRSRAASLMVILAGLGVLAATIFASVTAFRAWRRGARPSVEELLSSSPFLLLWVLNAAAFTAAGELVHIRYGLIAHVSILSLVWIPVLRALIPTARVSTPSRS